MVALLIVVPPGLVQVNPYVVVGATSAPVDTPTALVPPVVQFPAGIAVDPELIHETVPKADIAQVNVDEPPEGTEVGKAVSDTVGGGGKSHLYRIV
jgi:hypothetical protein